MPENATETTGGHGQGDTAIQPTKRGPLQIANLASRAPMLVRLSFLILLVAIAWISTPEFGTMTNLGNIVRSSAILGIVAVGMTMVTISGNFFALSAGATAAFAAVTFALLLRTFPVGIALVVALAAALVIGLAQGAVVAMGGNPVVVSLAASAVLTGLTAVASGNQTVQLDPPSWLALSSTQLYILLGCVVVTTVGLRYTRPGRRLILTGASPAAAVAAGLKTRLYTLLAFACFGIACGLAGLLQAAQFGDVRISNFSALDLGAVAAVLIAGNAVGGGEGSSIRTVIAGVWFVAALQNVGALNGWSTGVQLVFVGAMVVVVVAALAKLDRVHVFFRGDR